MKKKAVAAGHICIDITPTFNESKTPDVGGLLSPGTLVHVGPAVIHTGGSVANTGLAMKFFGADVSLAGKIGDDSFGNMIEAILAERQAEKDLIRRPGENTAYTIVLAIPGIDRIFLHDPGANNTFTADDLTEDLLRDTALFHFGYAPLMKKMYENEGEGLVEVMKKARSFGTATSLDFATVDPNSEAGRADWRKILQKTLPFVDIFVPSIEELMFMLDRDRFESLRKRAGNGDMCMLLNLDEDVRPLADACMEMGCRILLIKCGAPGLYFRTASEEKLRSLAQLLEPSVGSWAGLEGFEPAYVPRKVLSATGAGDTCIAAFLTALLEGFPLQKCLQYAAAAGASCVEAYDALSGLITFDEIEKKIGAGWKKNSSDMDKKDPCVR